MTGGQTSTSHTVETERLVLRWFEMDDLEALYVLGTDPQIIRYVGNVPFASLDAAREILVSVQLKDYANHGFGRFACVWRETGEVIGFCGPKFLPDMQEVELGYRFLPHFWGKGLATEAGQAAVGLTALHCPTPVCSRHRPRVRSAGAAETWYVGQSEHRWVALRL